VDTKNASADLQSALCCNKHFQCPPKSQIRFKNTDINLFFVAKDIGKLQYEGIAKFADQAKNF
jgi:hypothetical protein